MDGLKTAIMEAEELRDEIIDIVNNRPQHYHALTYDSWQSEKILNLLQQYNNGVSKKESLLFAKWILKKVDITLSDFLDDSWFDEWQKQK